jgi:hypothetical protein
VESDQTQAPPAEAADASLTPAPEDGASSASPHQQTASISDSDMDAAIRQLAGSRSPLPPELDSQTAADAAADVTDAVQTDAASPDGVRPTGQVKPRLSKVELAEQKAAELAAENARLQQALDAANPPPPDASEEARAQYLADEQRYRDLLNVPDARCRICNSSTRPCFSATLRPTSRRMPEPGTASKPIWRPRWHCRA